MDVISGLDWRGSPPCSLIKKTADQRSTAEAVLILIIYLSVRGALRRVYSHVNAEELMTSGDLLNLTPVKDTLVCVNVHIVHVQV